MTYEEVLWRLKDHFRVHRKEDKKPHPLLEQAIKLMYKAVEKQIPKKPELDILNVAQPMYCPNCESIVKFPQPYCCWCGQALKWE